MGQYRPKLNFLFLSHFPQFIILLFLIVTSLVGTGKFSLHHCIQTISGAHSASYTMGTRGSFPEDKAAKA